MAHDETGPSPRRKHLYSKDVVAAHAHAIGDEPTRRHRQGNGLRVHGIYFLAVSLAALAVLVVFIAVATAM